MKSKSFKLNKDFVSLFKEPKNAKEYEGFLHADKKADEMIRKTLIDPR